MKSFDNYIFDLYGTLIDIRTDEAPLTLWRPLSAFYSAYGADYTPEALREAYFRMVSEEEASLRRKSGLTDAEICLDGVFLRLLREAPARHRAGLTAGSEWVCACANLFRALSRERLGLFPGVVETLSALRSAGKGVYLLSNAQGIFTRPEMELCGIMDFFDAVYISSEYGMRKPEPLFMRRLLTREGLRPEGCVMIGNDFSSDMLIAARCSVSGIFLNTDGYSKQVLEDKKAALEQSFGAEIEIIPDGDVRRLLTPGR